MLKRSPIAGLVIAAFFLLVLLEFFGSPISPALAKTKARSEKLLVLQGTKYFVATNGTDDGPGTVDQPWATINHATEKAVAGDVVIVRGGRYILSAQVRLRNSGRPDAWITFIGYLGEKPVLDARLLPHTLLFQRGLDDGAFQIEGVSYIRVVNLTLINSQDAGFTVRDSSNIDLINNSTQGTFSSGIAVWDTNHQGRSTQHIHILGNTISKATTWDSAPPDMPRVGPIPQEALSIAGPIDFEIAYNKIYDSDKGGIDVKETSKRGTVHHNLIYNAGVGIYVDSWFGELNDVEIFSNVVYACPQAGIALSVENGRLVDGIDIHNNVVFNNKGSGLYFSRWGVNNERRNIRVHHNTFYHNGYGTPKAGQTYYWMTGGIYLYSTKLRDITIRNNIVSKNRGFQIGYSELFLNNSRSWRAVAREKAIQIIANLIDGRNAIGSPIRSGGNYPDRVKIYAANGDRAKFGDPRFKDPANQNFTLRRGSLAMADRIKVGAYTVGSSFDLWWRHDFPPNLFHVSFK